jgi:hypothetical protein
MMRTKNFSRFSFQILSAVTPATLWLVPMFGSGINNRSDEHNPLLDGHMSADQKRRVRPQHIVIAILFSSVLIALGLVLYFELHNPKIQCPTPVIGNTTRVYYCTEKQKTTVIITGENFFVYKA